MERNRHESHSVTRLTVHLVWVTKYRYHVLKGDVQQRCRELIIQICDAEDVRILKGIVSNSLRGQKFETLIEADARRSMTREDGRAKRI